MKEYLAPLIQEQYDKMSDIEKTDMYKNFNWVKLHGQPYDFKCMKSRSNGIMSMVYRKEG